MKTESNAPVINNIDAQLVLVFNNYAEMSDKELASIKKKLVKYAAQNPALAEPITEIIEMLGL